MAETSDKAERKKRKKTEKAARKAKKKEAKREAKKIKKEKRHQGSDEPQGSIGAYLAKLSQSDGLDRSVFQRRKMEILVSVLPAALSDITQSLEDSVRQMLMKYRSNTGVLLEFENLKRIGNNGHGKILGELPHLHYKVGFDALVFSPKNGSKVRTFAVVIVLYSILLFPQTDISHRFIASTFYRCNISFKAKSQNHFPPT
jgi:hypothetical protein